MPGCLRALDVMSIAAEPTITRGEGDPGRSECLDESAVRCDKVADVLSTRCFTVTGYLGDRFRI